MAAETVGSSDLAHRGNAPLDYQRPVFVIRDETEVHAVDASRSDFEPIIERLMGIEQFIAPGLYRVTILVESVADEGEAFLAVATSKYEESSSRRSDG